MSVRERVKSVKMSFAYALRISSFFRHDVEFARVFDDLMNENRTNDHEVQAYNECYDHNQHEQGPHCSTEENV